MIGMFYIADFLYPLKSTKDMTVIETLWASYIRPAHTELKTHSKNSNFVCRKIRLGVGAVWILVIMQAAVDCVEQGIGTTKGKLYGYSGE